MKIAVLGSSNTDMIVKVERLPLPGETVLGGVFSTAPGGKGANQAVAAARAGGRVAMIARVGDDIFGSRAVAGMRMDGIDVSHVRVDPGAPSGVALIFVDRLGENCIAVAPGANARLCAGDVDAAGECIRSAGILLMQLEIPVETVARAAGIARTAGVRVILNPAPARPLDGDVLRALSVITPNESEAEALTGIPARDDAGAERAADALLGRGWRPSSSPWGRGAPSRRREANRAGSRGSPWRPSTPPAPGTCSTAPSPSPCRRGRDWRSQCVSPTLRQPYP